MERRNSYEKILLRLSDAANRIAKGDWAEKHKRDKDIEPYLHTCETRAVSCRRINLQCFATQYSYFCRSACSFFSRHGFFLSRARAGLSLRCFGVSIVVEWSLRFYLRISLTLPSLACFLFLQFAFPRHQMSQRTRRHAA